MTESFKYVRLGTPRCYIKIYTLHLFIFFSICFNIIGICIFLAKEWTITNDLLIYILVPKNWKNHLHFHFSIQWVGVIPDDLIWYFSLLFVTHSLLINYFSNKYCMLSICRCWNVIVNKSRVLLLKDNLITEI